MHVATLQSHTSVPWIHTQGKLLHIQWQTIPPKTWHRYGHKNGTLICKHNYGCAGADFIFILTWSSHTSPVEKVYRWHILDLDTRWGIILIIHTTSQLISPNHQIWSDTLHQKCQLLWHHCLHYTSKHTRNHTIHQTHWPYATSTPSITSPKHLQKRRNI